MTNYEKDEIISGVVTGIKPYGIFVSIDDDFNGLIHISEMSNDFVKNVSDYAYIGETIKSKVLSVNRKSHQIKLSIKDIEYKSDDNNRIIETEHGFSTLESKLSEWIDIKFKEIEENRNQKWIKSINLIFLLTK